MAGLRERKKERTRAAIQEHALRLIGEQGYHATTIAQIADAAEVSESTFFRYFPTKEAVIVTDVLDPLFIEEFRREPPGLGVMAAMRHAFRVVYQRLGPEGLALQRERAALVFSEPELRAAWLEDLLVTIETLALIMGERLGRPPDDFEVRAYAGAVMGATLAAIVPVMDDRDAPATAFLDLVDRAFALVEALPIQPSSVPPRSIGR